MESKHPPRVRLAVWVHYDSETGYVWPQVYATEKEASHFDEKLNYPIKTMRLVSEPYPLTKRRTVSGSFGTEIPAEANALAEERESRARRGARQEMYNHAHDALDALYQYTPGKAADLWLLHRAIHGLVAACKIHEAQAPEKEER